jgi:hypothetical protein
MEILIRGIAVCLIVWFLFRFLVNLIVDLLFGGAGPQDDDHDR